jgi:N-methylhydantoinase B
MRNLVSGMGGDSAIGNQVWAWALPDGTTDAFIPFDGNWVGSAAGSNHDGLDLCITATGTSSRGNFVDIEVLESWFPLLFLERRTRRGADGAGQARAGGGNQFSFRTHGVDEMHGTLFGMRRWLPLQGMAGGRPGACAEFVVHRADGTDEIFDVNRSGAHVEAGDWYQIRLPCGGGFGDPLDRVPHMVVTDVADGRYDANAARAVYGVCVTDDGGIDEAATEATRSEMRRARLAQAVPAAKPVAGNGSHPGVELPLYPGVVQRGTAAYAARSGSLLAFAPDHWTDGCPVLVERLWGDDGPDVELRTYLDPVTGRALHVEAAVGDHPRTFEVNPDRWATT